MEVPSSGLCVVCGKVVNHSLVSVHASLVAQNGSIHNKMGQVVGVEQLEEACTATQYMCSICLKLLLNIVNLECKVTILKDEFRDTFKQGTQSRKQGLVDVQAQLNTQHLVSDRKDDTERPPPDDSWNTTPLNHYVKDETVEEFLSNISVDADKGATMAAFLSNDDTVSDRAQDMMSLIKDESPGSENTSKYLQRQLNTQLTLDANTDELSDLLPAQCLMGGNASCQDSQREEKAFSAAAKTAESDSSSIRDYPHTPFNGADILNHTQLMEYNTEGEGEKTCNTDTPLALDTEDSNECVPHLEGEVFFEKDSDHHTPQGTSRQSKGKPGSHTPKRRKRKVNSVMNTEEETTQTQEETTSEITQVEDLVITCELCQDKFSDADRLGQHRREAHSAIYCHVCELCPNTCYREKSKLTQHLQRNHKITAHKCPGCSHQTVSQNALDQHIIREHPESRYFECHICHKAFRTHRYLHFVHIKRCHLGLPIKYSCEVCNKGFVDKSSFENHKLIHSQAKNFTCKFCGSSFLTPYALKVHVNTHTREKKYQCEECGSAFLRMCNLCAHRRRFHSSSDVKLMCEMCGKSMATRKDLKRHQVAQHSKEKPFQCPHCPRCYAAKESLRSHLRTHTGDKPYVCGCGKAFHKSNVLRRHQRCVHEGEDLQQDAATAATAEVDSVQVGGDGEIGREEHMVVITLKECNPPAVYTVQSGTSHLEEILVSSEGSAEGTADAALLAEDPDGLPLLPSSLETLARGRLALSTPVLLTSLTAVPDASFTTQVNTVNTSPATHPANTFHTTPLSPASNQAIVQTQNSDQPPDTLHGLGPASCTDLLQLPALHTAAAAAAAATSVSLVTPWPPSAL